MQIPHTLTSPQKEAAFRSLHPVVALIGFLFGLGAAAVVGHTMPLSLWPLTQWGGLILGGVVGTGMLLGMRFLILHRVAAVAQVDVARARTALVWGWLPLLLSLAQFFFPHIDLVRDGALALGGLLLTAGLLGQWLHEANAISLPDWLFPAGAGLVAGFVYLLTMGRHVGQADSFEFQVTAYSLGVAHPTGYPLYVMLGHLLIKLLPFGSVAWRVNLSAAIPAALVVAGLVRLVHKSKGDVLSAWIAALALAFGLTFWQAATAAEVYALNALLVLGILLALQRLLAQPEDRRAVYWMALLVGLGLAHHLTILLTLPAIILSVAISRPRLSMRQWATALALALLGMTPIIYIPLRWPEITGEPMSWQSFWTYITARQFAGSLQWSDIFQLERWRILARITVGEMTLFGLALSGLGLGTLFRQRSAWGVVTLVMAGAYLFYGAAYNVPDVAVFLIPVFLLVSLWAAMGLTQVRRWLHRSAFGDALTLTLAALWPIVLLASNWGVVDRSGDDGGEAWARRVFAAVAKDAVILADSLRIAPLEYLHRVEGLGPEMDITVQGDEAGYRQALYAALNAGRHAYAARTLPGLEGEFHLRSAGPVVEISRHPLTALPADFGGQKVRFGDEVRLVGVDLDAKVWREGDILPLNLAWQRLDASVGRYEVRLRLRSLHSGRIVWEERRFAANGFYPTNAWKSTEIVLDYHEIPLEFGWAWAGPIVLEVGVGEPYAMNGLATASGQTWQPLGVIDVSPGTPPHPQVRDDVLLTSGLLLMGHEAPAHLYVHHNSSQILLYLLARADGDYHLPVRIDSPDGVVEDILAVGRLQRGDYRAIPLPFRLPQTAGKISISLNERQVTTLEVRAVSAQLANFGGIFALDQAELATHTVTPGDVVRVSTQWKTLSQPQEDYTIFVQAIGPDGLLHGQIDTYPLQGTLATSQWPAGVTIQDAYQFPLQADAPAGRYQIILGWYLLRTGERLPLLDENGNPMGDYYVIGEAQVR